MMANYDIVIVGGGLNSMITASLLAQKTKSILVLESRDKIGGLATTKEFSSGFKCNMINDVIKWLKVN